MAWDWEFAVRILPELLRAFAVTVEITLVGSAIAMVGGLVLALLRRSRIRLVSWTIAGLIEFVRSTPLLVQLYFFYFVLPQLGLTLSPLATGIFALSLHYSTYVSEVYRGGIASIEKGQWEAARALNMSKSTTWRSVILPQAIPLVVPALANYVIVMFKDTPLLSVITVVEGLQKALIIGSETFRYTEPLTILGLLFLVVSYVSAMGFRVLERRLGYAR